MRALRALILALAGAVVVTAGHPRAQVVRTTAPGTGVIAGTVVNADGRVPVGGVVVALTGAGRRNALTDAQGRFVFRDLAPGWYTLVATKPGWLEGAYGVRRPKGTLQELMVADGQRVDSVVIELWRPAAISGVVRDEYGDPFVGLEVRAIVKTFRTGDARWITDTISYTDDRGAYRLGDLTPGEYTVVLPSTSVANDRPTNPQFLPTPGSVLLGGKLVTTGIPMSSGMARGAPYVYRTTFYPNALTSSEATSMKIAAGDERGGIDFQIAPVPVFTVSGMLSNVESSSAVYSIELMRAAETSSGRVASISDIRVAMATADPGGNFMLFGVPAGQYVLRTLGSGPQGSGRPFAKQVLSVAGDVANLVVPLRPGAVVSGRLEFDGAIAPPDAERLSLIPVAVEALDPRDGVTQTGRVTADRRFEVRGLPGGNYLIMVPGAPSGWTLKSVFAGGRDVTDRAIEISDNISDVVLTFTDRPAQISGRVSASSSSRAGDLTSVLLFPGGGFPLTDVTWSNGARRFRVAPVDKNGAFSFGRLPPGDYFVAAVPEEMTANWIDAEFLVRLSALATPVRLGEGSQANVSLTTLTIQR